MGWEEDFGFVRYIDIFIRFAIGVYQYATPCCPSIGLPPSIPTTPPAPPCPLARY